MVGQEDGVEPALFVPVMNQNDRRKAE